MNKNQGFRLFDDLLLCLLKCHQCWFPPPLWVREQMVLVPAILEGAQFLPMFLNCQCCRDAAAIAHQAWKR